MPNTCSAAARRAFLEHLSDTGNVTLAAERAGIPRATLYREASRNYEFRLEWADAAIDAIDMLKSEAYRRAVEGIPRPIARNGQVVYDRNLQPLVSRRYSDSLLIFLIEDSGDAMRHRTEKLMGDAAWRKRESALKTEPRPHLGAAPRAVSTTPALEHERGPDDLAAVGAEA